MRPPSRWTRRDWLARLPAALWPWAPLWAGLAHANQAAPDRDPIRRGRPLVFPRDHGAHPGARIEWWYITGTLWPDALTESQALAGGGLLGFQITFFRLRTGLAAAEALPGRFAARQLLMAHAALTDVNARQHQHTQRLQRWNGVEPPAATLAELAQERATPEAASPARAWAARADADVRLGAWWLRRDPARDTWHAELAAPEATGHPATEPATGRAAQGGVNAAPRAPAGFALGLRFTPTQPVLLQGDRGFSRKGPREDEASHYYSLPQLAVAGRLWRGAAAAALPLRPGAAEAVQGRAWLDHEWSDTLLPPESDGWDWIGVSLLDGAALTAFRLRGRAEGAAPVWAGGSWRPSANAPVRDFAPHEVRFEPLAYWRSPRTGGRYPVRWRIHTPAGVHELHALLDAQELDGSASTGTVYWEGLAELCEPGRGGQSGRRLGLGYLEMTGYVGRFRAGDTG